MATEKGASRAIALVTSRNLVLEKADCFCSCAENWYIDNRYYCEGIVARLVDRFMDKNKLYCYVDETGQDTKGKLFIVVAVIVGEEKNEVEKYLESIEEQSGKGKRKWIKAREKEYTYRGKIMKKPPCVKQRVEQPILERYF